MTQPNMSLTTARDEKAQERRVKKLEAEVMFCSGLPVKDNDSERERIIV